MGGLVSFYAVLWIIFMSTLNIATEAYYISMGTRRMNARGWLILYSLFVHFCCSVNRWGTTWDNSRWMKPFGWNIYLCRWSKRPSPKSANNTITVPQQLHTWALLNLFYFILIFLIIEISLEHWHPFFIWWKSERWENMMLILTAFSNISPNNTNKQMFIQKPLASVGMNTRK